MDNFDERRLTCTLLNSVADQLETINSLIKAIDERGAFGANDIVVSVSCFIDYSSDVVEALRALSRRYER